MNNRVDDMIRTNPDLQGRISIIDMLAWNKTDLERIPQKRFKELGMKVSDDIIDILAKESISSPQLMQLICLNICILADSSELKEIDDALVKDAFRFSTLNLDYDKVVSVIQNGKSSRGQKRTVYQTGQFGELDLYGLILEALALDPSFASISFNDLYDRVVKLVTGAAKPSMNSVKSYLKNLQDGLESHDRSLIQKPNRAWSMTENQGFLHEASANKSCFLRVSRG